MIALIIAIGGIACMLTVAGIALFACEYQRAEYPPMVRKESASGINSYKRGQILIDALEAMRKIEGKLS